MSKPVLYIKNGCPWCVDALDYFQAKGLELEVVDVRAEPARMDDLLDASGQSKTPTLKYDDFLVADFDLQEFEAALAANPKAKKALGM